MILHLGGGQTCVPLIVTAGRFKTSLKRQRRYGPSLALQAFVKPPRDEYSSDGICPERG
jgi:hypothetical protein